MSIENETPASSESTETTTAIQKRSMDEVDQDSQEPTAVKKIKTTETESSSTTTPNFPQSAVSEQDVGITAFIRPDLLGWSGILKAR
jgi:hypothetical protein